MVVRADRRSVPGCPPAVASRGGHVVVLTADGIPRWVRDWCRRTHRELRVDRTSPDVGHPEGPGGVEHVRAVAGLAGEVVLVVWSDRVGDRPTSVCAALCDIEEEADVLRDAAEIAAESGACLTVLHAVPQSFGERSVGLDDAVDDGRRMVAAAAERLAGQVPGARVVPRLVRAHPHEVVGETLDADLLVLGGPRPGGAGRGLVLGSALQHAPCPVLLVPRRPQGSRATEAF